MATAEEAARRPRTRNHLGRRSVWNTSHPEKDGGRYYHHFVRYGRVRLDVHERVPEEQVAKLVEQLARAQPSPETRTLTAKHVQSLLIDAEVALFHYVADQLSVDENDLSPELIGAADLLADALEAYVRLSEGDAEALRRFVAASHEGLSEALEVSDDLDPYALRSALPQARKGRTKTGDPKLNSMLESFLDDWERRAHRPITHAHSPGSAHNFYAAALELMKGYPPQDEMCVIRSAAVQLLPQIWRDFSAPWDRAVRSAAGG